MNSEDIEKKIQQAKIDKLDSCHIYLLFISYCHSKNIGIYSKDAFHEIIRLFPKAEYPELYQYCIWMWTEQID